MTGGSCEKYGSLLANTPLRKLKTADTKAKKKIPVTQ